jgi:hypothetical protein
VSAEKREEKGRREGEREERVRPSDGLGIRFAKKICFYIIPVDAGRIG